MNDENQIGDRQGLAEISGGEIDRFQVIQHSRENLTSADGMQEFWAQGHFAGVDFVQPALAILPAEDVPAVEAVDQCLLPVMAVVLQQEMSGHATPDSGNPTLRATSI